MIMIVDFDKYRFEDGSIKKLEVENADVRVHVQNWRDEVDVLVFRDVIGFEGYSVINDSLSHGAETSSDPFLARCSTIGEEAEADFRCFSFFSAWTDLAILKIIARSFELSSDGKELNL
jgi:hypothetical protein